jgi:tetratricopeptide (TPR) repeat protein
MPVLSRLLGLALPLAAALALAGCDGAEERAEAHHRRALALAAEGDAERAAVEFRNALRLDPGHAAARLAFARLLRGRGEAALALGHYALLVEEDRDSLEGHRELAELALAAGDFETAGPSVARALALAPGDPGVRALKAALDYRTGDRTAAVAMAEGVVADAPGSVPAQLVLAAERMNAGDPAGALGRIEAALAHAPEDEGLHLVRLSALEELGEAEAVGDQLARMAGLFPGNAGVGRALVRWRMRAGDLAGAEAALRGLAAREPAAPEPALAVVQFLYETAGPGAARAELDRLIAAAPASLPFARARAGLDFAEGREAEAVAALRALVEGAGPSDARRDVQVELAGMLEARGDAAGRDALLAAALAEDPGHVGALKLRARAHVAADRPDLAIQDMRAALAEAPRDPEVLTVMALAHEREGARELAGERLALAVEVSGQAPEESLRFARFLMEDGRPGPAEAVVSDALRRAPDDPGLLLALGRIHAARGDWPRVEAAAARLRAQGPEAAGMAAELETASLEGQGRREEALEALRGLAGAGGDAEALGRLMRAHVAAGDLEGAQAFLDGVLAADPAGLPGRMMQAGLWAARGETGRAEALHRALIAEAPALPQPHRALVALLAAEGRTEEAEAALEAGLAAAGADGELLFLKAGLLEARGDFEGAIAAYETLYARDGADPLLANNLASLLATQRTDPESLERAFAVARRLRGSDVPHFEDTFGWILHRRGDSEGALAFLEPAARALGGNASVQLHLGEALLALGRREEARESFRRAVEIAETGSEAESPRIAAARARLAEIDAGAPREAPEASGDGG